MNEEEQKQVDLAMQALKDSHEFVIMKLIYSVPPEPLECPDGTKMETFGAIQYDMPKCWKELNLSNNIFKHLMYEIAKETLHIANNEA